MNNNETEASSPEDFDLFATPVDNHLAEELAKGTFAWTNKYTKLLGVLTIAVGLLSVGAWYGHHSAASSTTTNFSALRSAFTRGGAAGGFGGGSGTTGGSGGFGGGGFGTRVTGTIASVSGATVTITLSDPTQASSLNAGDTARVTDTAGAGSAPSLPSAPTTAGTTGSTPNKGTKPSAGSATGPTAGGATAKPRTARTPGAAGAAGTPGAAGGAQGGARGGGLFNNPAFSACLTKAGVTITPGQRPNFQDSATSAAIQSCMKSLGITFGGGAGGGGGGGGFGAGAPAGPGATSTTP